MYKFTQILVNREALRRKQCVRMVAINSTVVKKSKDQIKPWHEIPGPLSFPILGQLLHFLPGGWLYKRTIELQELLYNNYGPIVRLDGNLGFDPIIYIFDPEAAINLFRKEDPLPYRPGFESMLYHRKKFYNESENDSAGLILENGENWRKLRYSVNSVMLKPKTIKQYANLMAEVADDMIQRMSQIRNEKNMLEGNLYTELNLWALESVAVVALGRRLNCFDPDLPHDSPAKKLVTTIHDVLDATEKLDFQPSLWKHITTPAFSKGMKIYDNHMKLNEFFIDEAKNQLRLKGDSNDKDKSILEKLLEINRKVAVAMANDMMFAGVDTMNIIVGNQQLCLMEEQFPRPTEFIPERWIVDKSDPLYYGKAHPFSYTPFGFGVRSCIGRRLADLELETLIAKIVETFQIEWFGPPPKRTRSSTLNFFLGPYNFIFKNVDV